MKLDWRGLWNQILNRTDEPMSAEESAIHSEADEQTIAAARQAADDQEALEAEVVAQDNVEKETKSEANLGLAEYKTAIILVSGAATFLCLLLVKDLSDVIAPCFLGLNLAIVVYPAYRFLTNKKVPRAIAALVAGILVFTIVIALIWGLIWSVLMMVDELPNYSDQFTEIYRRSIEWLANMGLSEDAILQRLKSIDPNNIINVLTTLVNSASGFGAMIVTLIMMLFFVIMDTPGIKGRMEMIQKDHPRFSLAMRDFNLGVRRYWVVTSVFGAIVAVLDWAVLVALGVPLAAVWMLFSFLTNYIPNIGFVIGLIPPALLALVENGFVSCIIVIVLYWVLNFVVQAIIQPRYTGDAVGVTPTVSFLSLLLWAWALGGLGAILALPCTLLVKALFIDHDPKLSWVNAIISSDPENILGKHKKPDSPGNVQNR